MIPVYTVFSIILLVVLAAGFIGSLRQAGPAVGIMTALLLGTGGVALAISVGALFELRAGLDLALVLAALSSVLGVAFAVLDKSPER